MNWLLPSALGIAGVAALVAVALHFIARSRPAAAETLPTARFVPDRPVHARTRSVALSDPLLLLLRLAAIAALGFAVAGPVFGDRGRVVRIVAMDRSRSVASLAEVRDSVRAIVRASDVIIPFDSATFGAITIAQLDSLQPSSARGSLSAALAAVTGAAVSASMEADSIEVALVSPFSIEELDAATSRIRWAWPGRIRLVPVRAAIPSEGHRVEVRSVPTDAVAAGLALIGANAQSGNVRVVRTQPTPADSAWAREAEHVLIHWPATKSFAGWPRRPTPDAIGAVTANGATLVANLPRLWTLDGHAVARWVDGEPAVTEQPLGRGCLRDVAVLVDEASDITLRESFRNFARELVAPCGGVRRTELADSAIRMSLAGSGPLAPASFLRNSPAGRSQWTPWFLALGALLLFVELALRRTMRRSE